MKTYTSRPNDTLSSIAARANMPSWKYLYELNKSAIGENPDMLKAGTKLKIPQWDSTGGDEKIAAQNADASLYVGGTAYRYPWVPLSYTMVTKNKTVYTEHDSSGKPQSSFQNKKKYEIRDYTTKTVLASGELTKSDDIETLIPNSRRGELFIDGIEYEL